METLKVIAQALIGFVLFYGFVVLVFSLGE